MRPLPTELSAGPFTRVDARRHGVSSRMLQGRRFVRVFPQVFRTADHELSPAGWRRAAGLSLPDDAHLTGISRLQELGLDYGPLFPIRFVVARDHHLAMDRVFLHRTVLLPPLDDVGVAPVAAYLAYCGAARVVDAIKVGDWLLHRGHVSLRGLRQLAEAQPWRLGSDEAIWVSDWLDADARSVKESETRAILAFAGLPVPRSNVEIDLGPGASAIGDLVYEEWSVVVEYEGGHHRQDETQYERDIDRYALFRAHGYRYVQVTQARLGRPRALVGDVYRELLRSGYDGPPPVLGEHWRSLFSSVRAAVGPRLRGRGR